MMWADNLRTMNVRTNADQPDQSANAIAFGAEGIGLCRTEHMFFGGDRITAVRKMIVSDSVEERKRSDFEGIFEVMNGRPVTIRTLDPPLHEFLPHSAKEISELASVLKISDKKLKEKIESLHEFNPMLGFRGCRLGVAFPEITEMQARAIIEAAINVAKKGIKVKPEIMIPLVSHVNEFKLQEEIVRNVAKEVMKEKGKKIKYLVGTMIELQMRLPNMQNSLVLVQMILHKLHLVFQEMMQENFSLFMLKEKSFLPILLKQLTRTVLVHWLKWEQRKDALPAAILKSVFAVNTEVNLPRLNSVIVPGWITLAVPRFVFR